MEVHVFANQQQLGPFAPDAVVEMARLGSIPPDASVWHDGAPDWFPLSDFVQQHGPGMFAAAAPVQAAPAYSPPRTRPSDGPSAGSCVLRGVGAGFGVALIGGMVWFGLGMATGIRIPFVGLAIGWAVGKSTSWASRGVASIWLPVSAVLFTFIACAPLSFFSIYNMVALVFAMFSAWRGASE